MSRVVCVKCERGFRGDEEFDEHIAHDLIGRSRGAELLNTRCATDEEMRNAGMTKSRRGIWSFEQ